MLLMLHRHNRTHSNTNILPMDRASLNTLEDKWAVHHKPDNQLMISTSHLSILTTNNHQGPHLLKHNPTSNTHKASTNPLTLGIKSSKSTLVSKPHSSHLHKSKNHYQRHSTRRKMEGGGRINRSVVRTQRGSTRDLTKEIRETRGSREHRKRLSQLRHADQGIIRGPGLGIPLSHKNREMRVKNHPIPKNQLLPNHQLFSRLNLSR